MRGRCRAHVKARIRDLAAWFYDGEAITATYARDTEPDTDSTFELGPCEGIAEVESTDGDLYTDRYVIKALIETHGYNTAEEAEIAAERFLSIFEDRLNEHARLSHPEVAFEIDEHGRPVFDGIAEVYVSAVNGPRSGFPEGEVVGWIEFDITCMAHLQRST